MIANKMRLPCLPGKFTILKAQRLKSRYFFPVNLPPEKTIEVLNPDRDYRD